MVKFMLAASAAALVASAASAQMADEPSWTGPYAGINGGYGFDDGSKVGNRAVNVPNNPIGTGNRAQQYNQDRAGFIGGGQLGYNMQSGQIVYGAEGDFDYMDQYKSNGRSDYFGTDGRRTRVYSGLEWMGTARGRLGYSFGRGFFYGTGGYAFGRVVGGGLFNGPTSVNSVNYFGKHKYTAQGWTAGGGLEFMPFSGGMMDHISFKLEGNYYDLGRSHIYALSTSAASPGYYLLNTKTAGYNTRVGINYHF